jgi:hypothetical protein
VIERNASEHLPITSELFDLADMAGGLAAFISNRTTRFESDRGAATLLLLCLNWCPVTIYLLALMRQLQYVVGFDRQFLLLAAHTYAVMRQLQYVDGFDRQFLLLAAQILVRCHAAVAVRG